MKVNIKQMLLTLVLALLLALAFPQIGHALGISILQEAPPPLAIPAVITAWLTGWISFYVLEGFKKYIPALQGTAAHVASVITTAILTFLNGLLLGIEQPIPVMIVQSIFYFLIAYITSQGIFFQKKKDRAALLNAATFIAK